MTGAMNRHRKFPIMRLAAATGLALLIGAYAGTLHAAPTKNSAKPAAKTAAKPAAKAKGQNRGQAGGEDGFQGHAYASAPPPSCAGQHQDRGACAGGLAATGRAAFR
jgi:hypothetical protein